MASGGSGMSSGLRYFIVFAVAIVILFGLRWYIKRDTDRLANKLEQQMNEIEQP